MELHLGQVALPAIMIKESVHQPLEACIANSTSSGYLEPLTHLRVPGTLADLLPVLHGDLVEVVPCQPKGMLPGELPLVR